MNRDRRIAIFSGLLCGLLFAALSSAGAQAPPPPASSETPPTSRRYAVVRAGVVENVVSWSGATAWTPPAGTTLVEITTQPGRVEPRGTWDGTRFGARVETAAETAERRTAARSRAIDLQARAAAAAALATANPGDAAALAAERTRLEAEAAAALAEAAR